MMRKILALVLSLLWSSAAIAQIVGTLPFNLQNGSLADANQVMSDFNALVSAVNANAATAGANANITALNGLTTPLVYTSGGTSNYIGGTSSGSANAQVVASPIPSGFTLTSGKSITFIAGFTNTGPTQLNVAGTGLVNVFRQGGAGPVALSGQEIVAGNLVTATYDGTQYQIGNNSPQSFVQPCTVIDWIGANGGPSGYLLMNGQTQPRANFPTLFGCIAVQGVAATTASSSNSVVVPNSALFQIGWFVGGNNVTCNSTITAIPDGTHITISANAGAAGATTLTIGPFSQGDCSTTFAVGGFQGRATMMRDVPGTNLTTATCALPATIGQGCGAQTQQLTATQIPSITSSGSISVLSTLTDVINYSGTFFAGNASAGSLGMFSSTSIQSNQITSTGTANLTSNNTAGGSLGAAHPILMPVALVDKYIKF